jgi:transposase
MDRDLLSEAQWERIAPLLPGKAGDPGRSGEDNRLFIEAVLWLVRTGVPWRDLPERFGKWSSLWKRFRRWALKGVFERVFEELADDPDFEYALIDGTIVKVHRHGAGAKGGLKIRPSAARAADGPPRSWPWSMRSAISPASSCCPASATTASASKR